MYYENMANYPSYVPGYMPYQDKRIPIGSIPHSGKVTKEEFIDAIEGYNRGNLSSTTYYTYKGYLPKTPNFLSTRESQLYELSAYGFAMSELDLYLAIHPEDQAVMQFLSRVSEKYQTLKTNYEKTYGPLSICSVSGSHVPYEFAKGPWPWERG